MQLIILFALLITMTSNQGHAGNCNSRLIDQSSIEMNIDACDCSATHYDECSYYDECSCDNNSYDNYTDVPDFDEVAFCVCATNSTSSLRSSPSSKLNVHNEYDTTEENEAALLQAIIKQQEKRPSINSRSPYRHSPYKSSPLFQLNNDEDSVTDDEDSD